MVQKLEVFYYWLRGIRFLKCGADIKVYPESQQIDYGQLMITELNQGKEFKRFSDTSGEGLLR